MQIGSTSALFDVSSLTILSNNQYYNGGDLYLTTDSASRYVQYDGLHIWSNAPSGTAGSAITFTERMRITAAGNVGIGTASPGFPLDTFLNTGTGYQLVGRFLGGTNANGNAGGIAVGTTQTTAGYIYGEQVTTNSGALVFGTQTSGAFVQRMRIGGDGATGFDSNSTEGNAGLDKISIGHSGTYGWIQTWNATSMYLNRLGNAVYAGTQRIDNNSDERIKENIESIPNALSTILSLQGRKFNMLDEDGKLRYGFIAQEVQDHLSDFVTQSDRSFKKEDIEIENLLTLESSGTAWAALLVEAIKELKAEIDSLKTK